MRELIVDELSKIGGGSEWNSHDAIEVSAIFAFFYGMIGGIGAGISHTMSYSSASVIEQITVTLGGNIVTLPIAVSAGIGAGASGGMLFGWSMYYLGAIKKEHPEG